MIFCASWKFLKSLVVYCSRDKVRLDSKIPYWDGQLSFPESSVNFSGTISYNQNLEKSGGGRVF